MNHKLISNARENQDLFILSLFGKEHKGTYLEIGANHPVTDSNTYLLETSFGWKGLGIERHGEFVAEHDKIRTNKCIQTDATIANYDALLTQYCLGPHIDFLQVDIEPAKCTFKALQQIDFSKYSFSIITFEHDFYREGPEVRDQSREFIKSLGYTLCIEDVMHGDLIFEDWYINPSTIPNDNWKEFKGKNIKMNTSQLSKHTEALFNKLLK
jgi:hypothetical protein